jgi:hypothetical protein
MLDRSGIYPGALAHPHRVYVRVDVHAGNGALLQEDVAFQGGSVNATLTSRVARRLSLSLTEADYPLEPDDLWAPYGNLVRAYRGIEYGDGSTEFWQVFEGRIEDVSLDPDGQVDVICLDRAADVVAANFEAPYVSAAGPITEAFRQLVLDVFPDAVFDEDALDLIHESTPRLIFESDRAQACDDLASTAGAFWFPLADGTFTMLRVPWTTGDQTSLYTLADGPDGLVLASSLSRSRTEVVNVVTVYTERADGTPPLFYTAVDDDHHSPTFVGSDFDDDLHSVPFTGGNFGVRVKQVSLQTPTSQAQVRTAAQTLLRRGKALRETVALRVVPDASIELGDVFTADVRGRETLQCVAGYNLPLSASDVMTLECRSQLQERVGLA